MVQAVMLAMGSNGEQQMKLCSLTRPPLPSCCAAQFLTGHGLVPVCGPGVGETCATVNL